MTLLEDEDAMELIHGGPQGQLALWAWIGLVILAKKKNNGGVFRGSLDKYAPSLGFTPEMLSGAIERITDACRKNGNRPWIVQDTNGEWRIRNFDKWNNEWGGVRRGSGRPKKGETVAPENQDGNQEQNQVGIQDAIAAKAIACISSPSSPEEESEEKPSLRGADSPIHSRLLDEFWRWYPRKIGRGAAYPEMEAAIRRHANEKGTDVLGAHGFILSRVKAYANSEVVRKGDAQFVPAPAKWFKEERYNDDPIAWSLNGKAVSEPEYGVPINY